MLASVKKENVLANEKRGGPFAVLRWSQHTLIKSLSGHFILLFKPFQPPQLSRLWGSAKVKHSSVAFLFWFAVSLSKLTTSGNVNVSHKGGRRQEKWRPDELFLSYFHSSWGRHDWMSEKCLWRENGWVSWPRCFMWSRLNCIFFTQK